ncbi:hypothetical protein Tco_1515547 [Tanacetum coccineum]
MLVQGQILQGEGSTIPVESHHTPISAPSTSQPPTLPPSMPITHVAEEAATHAHDLPLLINHSLWNCESGQIRKSTLPTIEEETFPLNEVNELFETTMKRVNTFTPMESDDTVPKVVAGSSKIDAKTKPNTRNFK